MNLKCLLGLHEWSGCKCGKCDKARDEGHDWSADCEKCSECGKTRDEGHDWLGCKCKKCRNTRDESHDWSADCEKCSICGMTRTGAHDWSTGREKCSTCGKTLQRYVDNGNGTVTDNATGLMWTKNADHGPMNWYDAVKYCNNFKLAGYSDWRLPAVRSGIKAELDTLFRKDGSPYPSGAWEGTVGTPFTGVQGRNFWSNEASYGGSTDFAQFVEMTLGGLVGGLKADNSKYVWPVRGGR